MKVSVFMITYNHEAYIAKAIESIVAQKTNFDFELVIGEDYSTDNTLAICRQYAAEYPNIINLLPSDKNHGPMGNTVRTLYACKAEYIALCEGDDYWTDNFKLQKQFDFLEGHPDFSLCFGAIDIKDEMNLNLPYESVYPQIEKYVFTIEDVVLSEMNIFPTSTVFLRNVFPNPLPVFFTEALAGDMGIQLFAADKGKIKYLPEKMAVYRIHPGGLTKSKENIERGNEALMKLYAGFNKYFEYRYDTVFRKRFLNNAKTNLIFGAKDKKGVQRIKHYFRRIKDYIKYSDKINYKEMAYYHVVLFFPSLLKKIRKVNN